jgi:hypothetical protein
MNDKHTEERPSALHLFSRALMDGSLAGLTATAALAVMGKREAGSAAAPINATSHVLYGDEAGEVDGVDLKHTVPGLVINTGAGIFWAFIRELLLSRTANPSRSKAVAAGAATAALAHAVDYRAIPRRLTPGWELRVSRKSVALGFVALGAALAASALVRARR